MYKIPKRFILIIILAAILSLNLNAIPARAGINQWTSIGPNGGNIGVLVIHPDNPDIRRAELVSNPNLSLPDLAIQQEHWEQGKKSRASLPDLAIWQEQWESTGR